MKNIFIFIVSVLLVFNVNAQSSISNPFHFTFRNYTQYQPPFGLQVPIGPDYGCAASLTDRTIWFYFETCGKDSGASYASISAMTSGNGSAALVIWGPFDDTINLVNKLTTANIDTCGYLFGPVFFDLHNLQFPKIYIGMIGLDNATQFSQLSANWAGGWWFDNRCGLYNGKVTNYKQDICMVTLDTATQKNMIIWNKKDNFEIASFNIYRESVTAGQFDSIGNVPVISDSYFIDTAVNPNQRSYKYRISGVDSSGTTVLMFNQSTHDSALVHETIHLQSNFGTSNEINLSWNAYVGFNYSTFYIYRGNSVNNLQVIDSVSTTTFSYSDFSAPPGINYYKVTVRNPDGCSPDGGNTVYSQAFSNSRFASVINGVDEVSNSMSFNLYPNPFTDNFTVFLNKNIANGTLNIYNILGKKLFTERFNGSQRKFNCSLEEGIYFIELSDGNNSWIQKVIRN